MSVMWVICSLVTCDDGSYDHGRRQVPLVQERVVPSMSDHHGPEEEMEHEGWHNQADDPAMMYKRLLVPGSIF